MAGMRRAAVAVLCAALLAGCGSQMKALAPVSGDKVFSLRTAATDVLVERGLAIRDAPACAADGAGYTCTGSLVDGSEVRVASPTADAATMTVRVDGKVVYEGSVQDVLDRAAGIE